MEDSNKLLMLFFDKYKHVNNFEFYKNRLDEISRFRLNGNIKIKEFNIPDIGPSEELKNFHHILNDFDEESKTEIKYAIRSFEGDELETVEDCIILINILMKNYPNKITLLEKVQSDILLDAYENSEVYTQLIECPEEQSLLFSILFSFLVKKYNL